MKNPSTSRTTRLRLRRVREIGERLNVGEGGERVDRVGATREREQEKYFFHGKFQYPGLCFACLVHARLRTIHQGERKTAGGSTERRERIVALMTLSRGSSLPFVTPVDIGGSLVSVGRSASPGREGEPSPSFAYRANFILKPRTEGCS